MVKRVRARAVRDGAMKVKNHQKIVLHCVVVCAVHQVANDCYN